MSRYYHPALKQGHEEFPETQRLYVKPNKQSMKHTPLYAAHQAAGAKLVEFGGWEMPVYYSTITEEHLAVRKAGGIFDISHMGQIEAAGPDAERFLNYLLTNDASKLSPGWGQYSLMCNQEGGTVDDLYVYRLSSQTFLLVVNASRIEADLAWINAALAAAEWDVQLFNASDSWAAVALQGPLTRSLIDQVLPTCALDGAVGLCSSLRKNQAAWYAFEKSEILVACTGYTGEDGFEIVCSPDVIEAVWKGILEKGQSRGIRPCGLGARDTLRTEMCYPLYGHELNEQTSPIEAGLGTFVQMSKPDFSGRKALEPQSAEGVSKKLAAFRMTQRSAPPRAGYAIWNANPGSRRIGTVTSGTQSPSLNLGIGLGFVEPAAAKPGSTLEIDIRGKRSLAEIVPKPIYRKP